MLITKLPSVTHIDHLITRLLALCKHSLVGRTDERVGGYDTRVTFLGGKGTVHNSVNTESMMYLRTHCEHSATTAKQIVTAFG